MLGREAQLHAIDEAVPVVQWCLYLMEAASCCFVLEAAILTELYYLPPHPCFGALISPGLAPTGMRQWIRWKPGDSGLTIRSIRCTYCTDTT